jgi:hypothetical protein
MRARELRAERPIVESLVSPEQRGGRGRANAKRVPPIVRGREPAIRGSAEIRSDVGAREPHLPVRLEIGEADASGRAAGVTLAQNARHQDARGQSFDPIVPQQGGIETIAYDRWLRLPLCLLRDPERALDVASERVEIRFRE